MVNERNVNGEFAITFNKLFSTIQRVYQPVTLPVLTDFPTGRIFFRKDRNIRCQRT
ncbi:Uncharacterised protein [Shigella sonnei]|nr:hypothetical protein DP20_3221 [Shigella flexneri]CSH27286.1 Uncharacterised protein [Shigella sonnei]CSP57769.1 Uncharacterised protein [Shigella sonnei]